MSKSLKRGDRVYLAGAMRGVPYWNWPAFRVGAAMLREAGYEVVSPVELDDAEEVGPPPADGKAEDNGKVGHYLARDVAKLAECDGVVVLPGGSTSRGVQAELAFAEAIDLPWEHFLDLLPSDSKVSDYYAREDAARKAMERQDQQMRDMAATNDAFEPTWHSTWQVSFDAVDGGQRLRAPSGGEKNTRLARYDLIPPDSLRHLAEHYGRNSKTHGGKYDDRNWERGYPFSWSTRALLGHLVDWLEGENEVADSVTPEQRAAGIPPAHPLDAVIWHAMALRAFVDRFPENDDRAVKA